MNNKKLKDVNKEKLIISCKMINEIRNGLRYWKFDQIWPTNLYFKTLEEIDHLIQNVIISSDFSDELNINKNEK